MVGGWLAEEEETGEGEETGFLSPSRHVPTQPGALVCPKGVVEGCKRKTLKVPTSVT